MIHDLATARAKRAEREREAIAAQQNEIARERWQGTIAKRDAEWANRMAGERLDSEAWAKEEAERRAFAATFDKD